MERACLTCVYAQAAPGDEARLRCHRTPPVPLPDIARSGFPVVEPADWCGEHKPEGPPAPAPEPGACSGTTPYENGVAKCSRRAGHFGQHLAIYDDDTVAWS